MAKRKRPETWSHWAGKKATSLRPSSRVRVFERTDIGGKIYISRAWIRTPSGAVEARPLPPGTSHEKAVAIAQRTAYVREQAIADGRSGADGSPVTIERLLKLYHDSTRADRWSKGHRMDQDRMRAFWEATIGAGRHVIDLTPAYVERTAGRAARTNEWSSRTEEKYLKYLKAVTRWGWRKARLYDVDPLLGVETPDVVYDTSDRIYDPEEIRLLLTPHPEVDWRVTLAANIAADLGRRIGAIRQLRVEDLAIAAVPGEDGTSAERLFLHFRGEIEKTGRGTYAPPSLKTWERLTEAVDRKEVQAGGWLFPGGDSRRKSFWEQPIESSAMVVLLKKAEEVLKIAHVPGRGWHGIKRRHVTVGFEVSQGDASLVGDVTGNVSAELLRNVYRQQDRRRVTEPGGPGPSGPREGRREPEVIRGRQTGRQTQRHERRTCGSANGVVKPYMQ